MTLGRTPIRYVEAYAFSKLEGGTPPSGAGLYSRVVQDAKYPYIVMGPALDIPEDPGKVSAGSVVSLDFISYSALSKIELSDLLDYVLEVFGPEETTKVDLGAGFRLWLIERDMITALEDSDPETQIGFFSGTARLRFHVEDTS